MIGVESLKCKPLLSDLFFILTLTLRKIIKGHNTQKNPTCRDRACLYDCSLKFVKKNRSKTRTLGRTPAIPYSTHRAATKVSSH